MTQYQLDYVEYLKRYICNKPNVTLEQANRNLIHREHGKFNLLLSDKEMDEAVRKESD